MDISKNINEKIKALPKEIVSDGIKAVLMHIEIAEKHYQRGKVEHDSNLFTDVIYRTNHAFEGILKEAYITIEKKDATKVSPYEIEDYLSKNSVFKERVMELFTNYRKNWRNPSTHEYSLFFTEQEAFLAIVTVSAFTSILIDQIVEKLTYEIEKRRSEVRAKNIQDSIENYSQLSSIDKVAIILKEFSEHIQTDIQNFYERSDAEMVGILTAFFSNAEPKIQFNIEPVFSVGPSTIRPDMVLKLGNEDIILEVIQSRIYPEHEFLEHDLHTTQLKKLMKVTKKKYGILYYLPLKKDDQIMISRISTLNIRSVYPMDKGTYEMLEHDAEIYGNE